MSYSSFQALIIVKVNLY